MSSARIGRGARQARLPVISVGCGSFEVSWLRCEDAGVAVSGVVDAFVFAAEVVAPVGVEVAAGNEGADPEDGLGAFESHLPSGDGTGRQEPT
jgi:hypothetical protein